MPSRPGDALARHDPSRWTRTLPYRERSDLPFDAAAVPASVPVMLDTTVYIDAFKATLPANVAALIARNVVLHCATACAELAVSIGHLDPTHPDTTKHRRPLEEALQRMAPAHVVAPSSEAWTEAALVAGILARTQGYPKESRRALINDALLFFSAVEAKATLISRNIRHMDLLLQIRPDAKVLLYDWP